MTESNDFLPLITAEATTEDGVRMALAAILWIAFIVALVTAPAVVIAAWRVLL